MADPSKKKPKFKIVPRKNDYKKDAIEIGKKIEKLNPEGLFFSGQLGKLMPKYYMVMAEAVKQGDSKVREDLEKILGYAIAIHYGGIIASVVAFPNDFKEAERNERRVKQTAINNKSKIFS